jgi:hypothetical protein
MIFNEVRPTRLRRLSAPSLLFLKVESMDEHEIARAANNIAVIINYLRRHFVDFVIRVEERPPSRVVFILTDLSTDARLTLGVLWPPLGDRNSTSDLIQRKLNDSDIAGRLKNKKDYLWTVDTAPRSGTTRRS